MAFTRGLAVGVALAGAAVGLASPASAELTDGNYQGNLEINGSSHPWVVTPCGAGCKSVQWDTGDATGTDTYHLNGNIWTAEPSGTTNLTKTIDNNTLLATLEGDVLGKHLVQRTQLVKNG
jgi:hypothetical protein